MSLGSESEVKKMFERVDISKARCSLESDRQKLLGETTNTKHVNVQQYLKHNKLCAYLFECVYFLTYVLNSILGIVEQGFGDFRIFNNIIRGTFKKHGLRTVFFSIWIQFN